MNSESLCNFMILCHTIDINTSARLSHQQSIDSENRILFPEIYGQPEHSYSSFYTAALGLTRRTLKYTVSTFCHGSFGAIMGGIVGFSLAGPAGLVVGAEVGAGLQGGARMFLGIEAGRLVGTALAFTAANTALIAYGGPSALVEKAPGAVLFAGSWCSLMQIAAAKVPIDDFITAQDGSRVDLSSMTLRGNPYHSGLGL